MRFTNFLRILTAHANSHSTSCIERALTTKVNNDRADGHLLGVNDLGRSVSPIFLFRNRFYLQLSPHFPKMNKNQYGKLKKNHDFCPRDIESFHHAL